MLETNNLNNLQQLSPTFSETLQLKSPSDTTNDAQDQDAVMTETVLESSDVWMACDYVTLTDDNEDELMNANVCSYPTENRTDMPSGDSSVARDQVTLTDDVVMDASVCEDHPKNESPPNANEVNIVTTKYFANINGNESIDKTEHLLGIYRSQPVLMMLSPEN